MNHQPTQYNCRWYACLMEKMTSMIPAIGEALLHLRHMQRDLATSLFHHHQNWDAPMTLSQESRKELEWWKEWINKKNGLPIQKISSCTTPQIVIHVDASDLGWGVSSTSVQATGLWSQKEKEYSINARELAAIYFALKLHSQHHKGSRIKIFTDNITTLKYSSKSGETASTILQNLAVKIQNICNDFDLDVEYEHILGVNNIQADWLSRQTHQTQRVIYEATLPSRIFNR